MRLWWVVAVAGSVVVFYRHERRVWCRAEQAVMKDRLASLSVMVDSLPDDPIDVRRLKAYNMHEELEWIVHNVKCQQRYQEQTRQMRAKLRHVLVNN